MLGTMLMPQGPPTPSHMAASKMSLALLPSYGQSTASSPSKRPKLSLNTTDVPASSFGKGSTSLRLETLSTTSPTSRNTFKNAYKSTPTIRTSTSRQQKPVSTPVTTGVSVTVSEIPRATSEESDSSASVLDPPDQTVPYKVAYTMASILSNSALPRKRSRQNTKTMFPAIKRVAFRTPLTEDVKNSKYVLKHSDIESSTSTISTLELSPREEKESTEHDNIARDAQQRPCTERKTSPPPLKRESSDDEEEDDDDTCPATPIAGRHKRSRQWAWTLGPVHSEGKLLSTDRSCGKEVEIRPH